MEFEWDTEKERSNIRRHNATFTEAVETFFDPNGFQMVDKRHSHREPRFYWIGRSKQGRILTTWFTRRDAVIRIIGCAEWRRFRRLYNETAKVQ